MEKFFYCFEGELITEKKEKLSPLIIVEGFSLIIKINYECKLQQLSLKISYFCKSNQFLMSQNVFLHQKNSQVELIQLRKGGE